MTGDPSLRIRVNLRRGDFTLKVDLTLPSNGITVLFGPSGSGKTTVLRCLAGLEKADGLIALGDDTWQDTARNVFKPTWQREVGYVFQEASLFEHLNVKKNLHFGLRRAGKTGLLQGLQASLDLLGIGHLLDRTVDSLSGGERQRVAIARALAMEPRVLLCDEITSALDPETKSDVLNVLEEIRAEGLTIVMVTHEIGFARRAADRVALLADGHVAECGAAADVIDRPSSERAARFLAQVMG